MRPGGVDTYKGMLYQHFTLPPSSLSAIFELAVRRVFILHLLLWSAVGDGVDSSVTHFLAEWPKVALFEADIGSRFAFRCDLADATRTASRSPLNSKKPQSIFWKKNQQPIEAVGTTWHLYKRQTTLFTSSLRREDAGNYTCERSLDERTEAPMSAQLIVRTPPSRLVNMSVRSSQVFASVRWAVAEKGDGGAPITHFTLVYQQVIQAHFGNPDSAAAAASSTRSLQEETAAVSKVQHLSQETLNIFGGEHRFRTQNETSDRRRSTHLPLHISPSARQYFIYHLRPNALYQFKMWATNRLGSGEPSLLYISTGTVQKKSISATQRTQTNDDDSLKDETLRPPGLASSERSGVPAVTVIGYADDEFSTTAWMVAVTMVFTIVVVLAMLSCVLIYKEASNDETAFVSLYASDAASESYRHPHASAGFHSSTAAMQILLDPARSFRRFYRPQRVDVVEERAVLLAEVVACDSTNDRSESPSIDISTHSVVTRSLRPLDRRSQQQHH